MDSRGKDEISRRLLEYSDRQQEAERHIEEVTRVSLREFVGKVAREHETAHRPPNKLDKG